MPSSSRQDGHLSSPLLHQQQRRTTSGYLLEDEDARVTSEEENDGCVQHRSYCDGTSAGRHFSPSPLTNEGQKRRMHGVRLPATNEHHHDTLLESLQREDELIEIDSIREETLLMRAELTSEKQRATLLQSKCEKLTALKDQLRGELIKESSKRKELKVDYGRLEKENDYLGRRVVELEELVKTVSLNINNASSSDELNTTHNNSSSRQPAVDRYDQRCAQQQDDENNVSTNNTGGLLLGDEDSFSDNQDIRVRSKSSSPGGTTGHRCSVGRTQCDTPPETAASPPRGGASSLNSCSSEQKNSGSSNMASSSSAIPPTLLSPPQVPQLDLQGKKKTTTTRSSIHSILSQGTTTATTAQSTTSGTPHHDPAVGCKDVQEGNDEASEGVEGPLQGSHHDGSGEISVWFGSRKNSSSPVPTGCEETTGANLQREQHLRDYQQVIREMSKELQATRLVLQEVATDRAGLRSDLKKALTSMARLELEKQTILFSPDTSSRHRGGGGGDIYRDGRSSSFTRTRSVSPYNTQYQQEEEEATSREYRSRSGAKSHSSSIRSHAPRTSSSIGTQQVSSSSSVRGGRKVPAGQSESTAAQCCSTGRSGSSSGRTQLKIQTSGFKSVPIRQAKPTTTSRQTTSSSSNPGRQEERRYCHLQQEQLPPSPSSFSPVPSLLI